MMSRWGAIVILVGAFAASMTVAYSALAANPESLAFVDDEPLTILFDGAGAAQPALVALQNVGAARDTLQFRLLVARAGRDVSGEFAVSATPTAIGSNGVEWFALTFSRTGGSDMATGYLVALDEGAIAGPAAKPVALLTDQRLISLGNATLRIAGLALPGGPGSIIGLSALLAAVTVLGRAIAGKFDFADTIGLPTWDRQAWVGTLTVVGAVLGTALAGILPSADQAVLLTGTQYAGLHVLAAATVGLAPLVFAVVRARTGIGTGLLFLVFAFAVFWAAIVELFTLLIGLADVSGSVGSDIVSWLLTIVGIVGIAAVMVYGWQAMGVGFKAAPTSRLGRARVRTNVAPGEGPTNFSMF
ncbi:hypothetical protein BH23CHL6_BH23CHL6_00980 [soil metagenome]